jgi:serine/threonine protein kinase
LSKASFGKFRIVGQIARGGMAEVFLCRLQGIGGFEKDVVVKCIIPERADDPNFVTMFLDEARVAANLSHPGIVQVFEIGEDDGIPYIAMEYVKGVTLDLVVRALQRRRKMHYGHCAKIIAGICEALDYAHNAVGTDGEPLGLVHRDVTPGNIVISREGVPKLLDFGVAKSNHRLAETEAGTLKGKVRYMSPEQLSMAALDHRADIFSLGVCLYELTTGHHPFSAGGDNDVALIQSIMEGECFRPSAFVADYPRELEEIVLWAIARPADRRCPTARAFYDRLAAFTAVGPHHSSTREVVTWLRELIPDFGSLTRTGTFGALGSIPGSTKPARPMPAPVTTPSPTTSASTRMLPGSAPSQTSQNNLPRYRPSRGRAFQWTLGLAVAGAAGLLALMIWLFRPVPDLGPPARPPLPAPNDDDTAQQYLDAAERLAAQERFDPALHMLTKAGELHVKNADLNIRLAQLRDTFATAALIKQATSHLKARKWSQALESARYALDRNPDHPEALRIAAAAQAGLHPPAARGKGKGKSRKDGTLTISTTPPAVVFVDDDPVGRSPLRRQLSVGPHRVRVRAQGYRAGDAAIRIRAGQTVNLVLPLVPETAEALRPVTRSAARSASNAATTTAPPAKTSPSAAKSPAVPATVSVSVGAPVDPFAGPPPARVATGPTSAVLQMAPVVSAMPHSPIPKPTLPRLVRATESERLWQVCQTVELLVVSRAGVTREFARGITGPLRRQVGQGGLVYPVAMYYFIVHEAALRHDNLVAAANLAAAHRDGSLVKLNDLPALERDL